jgi:hemolysin III
MVHHPDPWRESSLNRPSLRGWLHVRTLPVWVVASVVLVVAARSTTMAILAMVTGVSVTFMLVTSSIFHKRWWADDGWRIMRQLDQTAIYFVIAGSFTGMIGPAPDGGVRMWHLLIMWLAVSIGIALRWAPFELPYGVQSGIFVVIGSVAGLSVPLVFSHVSTTAGVLILIGGAFYLLGVLALGLRKPDPWPTVFGYHEVWHTLVVGALVVHYIAIWIILT